MKHTAHRRNSEMNQEEGIHEIREDMYIVRRVQLAIGAPSFSFFFKAFLPLRKNMGAPLGNKQDHNYRVPTLNDTF